MFFVVFSVLASFWMLIRYRTLGLISLKQPDISQLPLIHTHCHRALNFMSARTVREATPLALKKAREHMILGAGAGTALLFLFIGAALGTVALECVISGQAISAALPEDLKETFGIATVALVLSSVAGIGASMLLAHQSAVHHLLCMLEYRVNSDEVKFLLASDVLASVSTGACVYNLLYARQRRDGYFQEEERSVSEKSLRIVSR